MSSWIDSITSVITDGKKSEILRTQVGLIEAQRDDALLKVEKLTLCLGELESEKLALRQEIANLRKAVSEQRRIDDQAKAILKRLFDQDVDFTVDSIASAFGLQTSVVKFHIDELAKLGLVEQGNSEPQPYRIGMEQPWSKPTVRISAAGRRHVVKSTV